MNCMFCDTTLMKDTKTNYERNIKGIKYIVKNVPALFCQGCSDYYFDNKIIEFIRTEFIEKTNLSDNALTNDFVRVADYEKLIGN